MRLVTLLYHDVVRGGDFRDSGFEGADADVYKLRLEDFEAHLEAIAGVAPGGTVRIGEVRDVPPPTGGVVPLALTFDDGGASAYPLTAELLGERGWTGHFFVTGNRIGTPGFVTASDIRALDAMGHVVGGHSYSHPPMMSRLARPALVEEWRRSLDCLAEILGRPVRVASVPGGYYSRQVAAAAAEAGLTDLFTSEPAVRTAEVEGCRVYGRFTVQRGMTALVAADLVAGRGGARHRQWVLWNAKKTAKALGGRHYIVVKNRILASREASRAD